MVTTVGAVTGRATAGAIRGPLFGGAFGLALAGVLLAAAQSAPAAEHGGLPPAIDPGAQQGRILRELREREAEREAEREEREPIEGAWPEEIELPEAEVTFTLEDIEYGSSKFIDDSDLQAIVEPYIGTPIRFEDINKMVAEINARYRQLGIITAIAYVPEQRLDDDVLRIELLEGRLGGYLIEGGSYTHESFLRAWLALEEGEVIDVPRLRDRINRLNSTTGLNVDAAIEPGAEAGESDVRVAVQEPSRLRVSAFADNHGSVGTGEVRAGLVGIVNGPLGRGDRLTAQALRSEGSRDGVLRYDVPFEPTGGIFDLTATIGRLDIVDGPFEDQDVEGESWRLDLGYRRPLLLDLRREFAVAARLSRSHSETTIADVPFSEFEIDEGDLRFEWSGRAAGGRGLAGQSLRRARVTPLEGDDRHYSRFPGDAFYARPLGQRFSARIEVDWQWAPETDMPSALLYSLGGATTVRGYEQGVVSGGRGLRTSITANYLWRTGLNQSLFFDYGRAYADDPDSGETDSVALDSVGTGITFVWAGRVQIEASVGMPLRELDDDQDSYRAHLRANIGFGL